MENEKLIPWQRSLYPARLMDTHKVELLGGSDDLTLVDLEALIEETGSRGLAWPAKALVALRTFLGTLFAWDHATELAEPPTDSYFWQMTDLERELCPFPPGEMKGPGRVLWNSHRSMVLEVLNQTCQAFAVVSMEGRSVSLSVFVIETKWWSKYYLALIEPFRKYIVYPALVKWFSAAWKAHVQASLPQSGE